MRIHCNAHDMDVVVYDSEEQPFVDDNRREVSIIGGEVVRYVIGGCDRDCKTVIEAIRKQLDSVPAASGFVSTLKRFFGII